MRATVLQAGTPTVYAVVFDAGDEAVSALTAFARDERIGGAHFTAIGAFARARLGYYERARRDYRVIAVDEQVEVLTLAGSIALADAGPKVHAHVVVGRADGSTRGGHLLEGHVWPTLELVLTESPVHLRRRHDPATGLALLDLAPPPPPEPPPPTTGGERRLEG